MAYNKRGQLRLQRGIGKFSSGDGLMLQYLEAILNQLDFITQELTRMKQPMNDPNRMNEYMSALNKGLIGNYKLPARGKGPLPKQGPPQSVIS